LYLILLALGLFVGAVFLIILLIGDKRESRLEAQKKAYQEHIASAYDPIEGAWPPPPTVSASSAVPEPASGAKSLHGNGRKIMRTFLRYRNTVAGVLFVSAIVYASYPEINFVWVLLGTVTAAILLQAIGAYYQKRRRTSN